MSRWTKFRDRGRAIASGVIRKPLTDIKFTAEIIRHPTRLAPSYVLSQDRATSLDKLALGEGVSDLRAVRNTGRIVGAAVGLFYGGAAAYSAAGGGATAGATELGVAGTDVVAASGSTAAVGSTAAAGGSVFSASNISTLGLVLSALRKGNIAGAVDAATGTDWGSQAAAYLGGGSAAGGGGSRMGPNDGPQLDGGSGGISPIFLIIGGVILIVGLFFLGRKVFKHGTR